MVSIESKLNGVSEAALQRFVTAARRAARVAGDVHVLVISPRRMQTLNRQFRGKDKPTDVLSFPALPEVARDFAGDIVICGNIAAANARRLKHDVAQEVKVLVLHGVLHLAGYDHESDNGEMARLEQRLRKQLGLRDGLIERSAKFQMRSAKQKKVTSHLALSTSHSRRRRAR